MSIIYYQLDSATKALYYKAKYPVNLKPDPTLLDAGHLIMVSYLTEPWTLICVFENRPFSL